MKKAIYAWALALVSLTIFSFTPFASTDSKAHADFETEYHEMFKKDFMYTVSNAELETRFETQFYSMIAEVTKIDVHFNEINEYYYAVHGIAPDGNKMVEHFKTTAAEVANKTYNYIEMTERSMEAINANGFVKCREATSWPFPIPNAFCHQTYNGPICGFVVNGYCWYY